MNGLAGPTDRVGAESLGTSVGIRDSHRPDQCRSGPTLSANRDGPTILGTLFHLTHTPGVAASAGSGGWTDPGAQCKAQSGRAWSVATRLPQAG